MGRVYSAQSTHPERHIISTTCFEIGSIRGFLSSLPGTGSVTGCISNPFSAKIRCNSEAFFGLPSSLLSARAIRLGSSLGFPIQKVCPSMTIRACFWFPFFCDISTFIVLQFLWLNLWSAVYPHRLRAGAGQGGVSPAFISRKKI